MLFGRGNRRGNREGTVVVDRLIYKGVVVGVLRLTGSSLVRGAHVHLIFKGAQKVGFRVITVI
jgi:hypothetical protein